jgi:hypothetical protein
MNTTVQISDALLADISIELEYAANICLTGKQRRKKQQPSGIKNCSRPETPQDIHWPADDFLNRFS